MKKIRIGLIISAVISTSVVAVYSASATTPAIAWSNTPSANIVSYSVIGESNMLTDFSGNVRVVVTSSNPSGLLKITTTSNLTTIAGYDNSTTITTAGYEIAFEGPQADANNALASLSYQGSAAQDDTITVTATDAGFAYRVVVDGGTTTYHYYKAILGTTTWVDAFNNARDTAQLISGTSVNGWPVTITSAEENDFVSQYVSVDSWIGASDDFSYINLATGVTTFADQTASEGNWYWVVGEPGVKGTKFSTGSTAEQGKYANWAGSEPNNSSPPGEHVGQLYVADKKWNDLPATNTQGAYIWEYASNTQLLVSATVSKTITVQSDPPPAITSISPSGGTAAGGTSVTITGTGFTGTSDVTFGGVAGTSVTVVSDTEITVVTPVRTDTSRTVGAVPVIVTAPTGASNSDKTFTFRPVIDTTEASWATGTGLTLGELASRSQRSPVVRTTSAPFTTTGTDSRSNEAYSFVSDSNYGNSGAYAYESDERTRSGGWSFTRTTGSTQGRSNVITLNSGGNCNSTPDGGSGYNTKDGYQTYCSVFGPDVFSEPFYATSAQSISFDWKAIGGGDDYEIYAFLVALDDLSDTTYETSDHTIVTHGMGGSSDWATASTAIPSAGYYKFRFVNGSFDRTGGLYLGAQLFVHNEITVGLSNVITFANPGDQIGASDDTFNFNVSSTSAGDVAVTSSTTSVCTVSAASSGGTTTVTVTKKNTGTCTLTASQGAVGTYAPAQNVVRSFVIRSSAVAPSAPTITSIIPGDQQLSINFIAGGNGGASITNYAYTIDGTNYVAFSPAQTSSPLIISNLDGGTTYNLRIKAINSVGQGAQSNQVSGTPTGSVTPPVTPGSGQTGPAGTPPTPTAEPTPSPTPTPTRTPLTQPTTQVVAPTNPLPTPTPTPTQTPTTQSTPQTGSPNNFAPLVIRTIEEVVETLKPVAFDALVGLISKAIDEIRSSVGQNALVLLLDRNTAESLVDNSNSIILETPTAVLKDGVAEPARIVVIDTSQLQVVSGEGGLLKLEAKDGEDAVPVDSQGRLQMLLGNLVEAEGTGFAGNSEFAVWLFSEPTMLGIGKTDAAGRFFASFPVEKSIPLGDHTLQVVGVTSSGEQRSISLPVIVLDDKETAMNNSIENVIQVSQNPVQKWFDSISYLALLLLLVIFLALWMLWIMRRRKDEEEEEIDLQSAQINDSFLAPPPTFEVEASVAVAKAAPKATTTKKPVAKKSTSNTSSAKKKAVSKK